MIKTIYCCNCEVDVPARLTDGSEIYPHRKDLYKLPFWKCDCCNGKVGCHHKTKDRTRPLGVIPTPEISKIRGEIHSLIDPIWKGGDEKRKVVYKMMSDAIGFKFHSAEIKNKSEAILSLRAAIKISEEYSR